MNASIQYIADESDLVTVRFFNDDGVCYNEQSFESLEDAKAYVADYWKGFEVPTVEYEGFTFA